MRGTDSRPVRVLVLTSASYHPPFVEEVGELHRAGKVPRVWLLELPMDLQLLDQRFLTRPPRLLRALYRLLPIWAAQTVEAYRVCRRYDVVFAWGAEAVAMPFALLLKLTRRRVPFVTLFTWVSRPKKARFLRAVHSHITTLIIPPVMQRDYAVSTLGIPSEKVVRIDQGVDTDFWYARPGASTDMICAAGREMRDYETLIAALSGLDIPCHIAGALVRGKKDRWRRTVGDHGERTTMPPNVTFGPKPPLELRDLYARSRFVVIPLRPTDTDNGITCMMEAWSVGRPVICSAVLGQRDAFEHGREGLFVEPGDVDALRKAILELWGDPARAAAMGAEGRKLAEKRHRVTDYGELIGAEIFRAARI
jgi:glycosyltransferase involved in cell wall biosynthesis